MTPLEIASASAGSGIATGVAPSAPSILLVCRVGARILRPLKSAITLICLRIGVDVAVVVHVHRQRLDAGELLVPYCV